MWKGLWLRVGATLRRDFLAGLLVFIPVGFTVLGLLWIVERLDQLVLPRVFKFLGFEGQIPFLGVITTLAAILLAGALTRSFIGRAVLRFWERVVDRIPVARSLYSILKQSTEAFIGAGPGGDSYRRVVLIEYPRKGIFTYAFVTGRVERSIEGLPADMVMVFVPSTPNPTTGYLLLLPEADVVNTGLTVEEAFRLIISAGIASDDEPSPLSVVPSTLPAESSEAASSPDG
ncbi:MAG: DUF502 domain-containing protein [Deltaproteobacteria bacterium]|nr:MAG: DUF502 domain-containing protein [Deltaproteobacteria bacterium]